MVRVLVLGATGYIGLELCRTLRRSSHEVYGLARTAEKAKQLAQNEVFPVIGTVEDGAYLPIVKSANIDIVVDAAGANKGSYKILEDLKQVGKERLEGRSMRGPKLGFIYTSGAWVHGSSKEPVNDLNPVGLRGDDGCRTAPAKLTSWRPELESAILDNRDILDTAVLLPALLYGGSSGNWSLWFSGLHKAAESKASSVSLSVDPNALLSLIHVDDTATSLQGCVERLPLVSHSSAYPVFDAVTSREPVKPIIEAAARALGFVGEIEFKAADNPFSEAMNTSLNLDSLRLRDLLGWQPKRNRGMLDDIKVVVEAWKAYQ